MGLFDGKAEQPVDKRLRYAITGIVFALLLALGVSYLYRNHAEKRTIRQFLDTLVAGDQQQAYRIWKPNSAYSFDDFQKDWGPKGEFGPVRSYRLERAHKPNGGSGVIMVIEVCKFQPFPADSKGRESQQVKEVRLWVESSDKAISFAP
jgi:hypothetical protein